MGAKPAPPDESGPSDPTQIQHGHGTPARLPGGKEPPRISRGARPAAPVDPPPPPEAPVAEAPPEVRDALPSARFHKYVRTKKLGAGAFGEVWKAWDAELSRWAALKLLKFVDDDAVAVFKREAHIAANLEHRNIAAIHELGEFEGQAYIAMQYVEGQTLRELPRQGAAALVRMVRDACLAVDFAHEKGIVHRDIKPENIMVKQRGMGTARFVAGKAGDFEVFVLDFGLAMPAGRIRSGEVVGTPSYMPPEQARGERADARADVYSLGATLYFGLTGRRPHEGRDVSEVLQRVQSEEIAPPRRLDASVDVELEMIVMKCLAKERRNRYATAGHLASDLERWLEGDAVEAHPPSRVYRWRKWLWKRKLAILSAAGAAGVVGAVAVLLSSAQARSERARVREALGAKREIESRFASLVKEGKFGDAIKLGREKFGTLHEAPKDVHPSRLEEAEFAELKSPYRLELATAYWKSGEERLKRGDALGRADLANAFGVALEQGVETAGRDALLRLSEALLAAGEHGPAARIATLCASHFGLEDAETRAALARACEQVGRLEDAAGLWHSLERDGAHGAKAREALSLLKVFLPRQQGAAAGGRVAAADFEGDGDPEVVTASEDWTVRLFRFAGDRLQEADVLRLEAVTEPPLNRIVPLDVDGDGRPELVAAGGSGSLPGWIHVLKVERGRLVRHARGSGLAYAAGEVWSGDMDGDRTPELIVGVDGNMRGLVFWQVKGAELRPVCEWNLQNAIPTYVRVMEGGKLMVWLSTWTASLKGGRPAYRYGDSRLYTEAADEVPWGYRLVVFQRDERGFFREAGACPDRIIGAGVHWEDAETCLLVGHVSTIALKNVPSLKRGLHRIRLREGLPGPAEPLGEEEALRMTPPFALDGRPHVVVGSGGAMWSVPMKERGLRRTIRPAVDDETVLLPLLLQRGGRPVMLGEAAGALQVFGAGPYAPPAMPAVPKAAIGAGGKPTPERDLLEAGVYAEAESVYDSLLRRRGEPELRYGLGLACAAQRKWERAAEAFAKSATGGHLRWESLRRRAHALEELRDWPAVAECLEEVAHGQGAPPLDAAWARARLESVRPLTRLGEALRVKGAEAALPFVCENPMKAVVTTDGMALLGSSDCWGDAAGWVVSYGGGPLRITMEFEASEMQWAGSVGLGLMSMAGIDSMKQEYAAPAMGLWWAGSGGGSGILVDLVLRADAGDGRMPASGVPTDSVKPDPSERYTAVLEYVPGVERAYLDVRAGRKLAALSMEVPLPLPRGLYLLGRAGGDGRGGGNYQPRGWTGTRTKLHSLVVEAGSGQVRSWPPDPRTGRSWLAAANGLLVRGRLEEADGAYATALLMLQVRDEKGADRWALSRAHLFRGLLRLRQGKRGEAEADVREAVRVDRETVERAVALNATALLPEAEQKFFKGIVGVE